MDDKETSIVVPARGTRGASMPGGPLIRFGMWVARGLYRLGVGRRMDGEKVILLTTRGARSGKARTAPVMAFDDEKDAWLVIASFGGAARNPNWFVNLARHPEDVEVEVEGRRVKVRPTRLEGAARAEAWQRIVKTSPRFAGYQEKTDRDIPVVRLTAV